MCDLKDSLTFLRPYSPSTHSYVLPLQAIILRPSSSNMHFYVPPLQARIPTSLLIKQSFLCVISRTLLHSYILPLQARIPTSLHSNKHPYVCHPKDSHACGKRCGGDGGTLVCILCVLSTIVYTYISIFYGAYYSSCLYMYTCGLATCLCIPHDTIRDSCVCACMRVCVHVCMRAHMKRRHGRNITNGNPYKYTHTNSHKHAHA